MTTPLRWMKLEAIRASLERLCRLADFATQSGNFREAEFFSREWLRAWARLEDYIKGI